ncbi:MAG: hypothetical protein S4CHLAM81_02390 [Chlamydiales bacterium]|nr:hypothetical protein [Chlamydiales bacterium]MCH9635031.1 hypothetical protein [Chlamydiales bacterium]
MSSQTVTVAQRVNESVARFDDKDKVQKPLWPTLCIVPPLLALFGLAFGLHVTRQAIFNFTSKTLPNAYCHNMLLRISTIGGAASVIFYWIFKAAREKELLPIHEV